MLVSVILGVSMSNTTLTIQLPKSWPAKVRSAMLHVVSLAKYAAVYTRSWAADCPEVRVRLRSERDRLQEDNALLREELRIKDARMARIPAHQRPFYHPSERLAILELKAARGWSLAQTAKTFFVCPKTIAAWMKRIDEDGAGALVQVPVPVNKFRSAPGNHDHRANPQRKALTATFSANNDQSGGSQRPHGHSQASQP